MFFGIIALLWPLSSTFFRLATLNASTAGEIAITFLASHRTFCACLAFFGHSDRPDQKIGVVGVFCTIDVQR